MLAGTRLTATMRSPPTASVRLRKSVVVVTTWRRCCANAGDSNASRAARTAKRNTMDGLEMRKGSREAALPCFPLTLTPNPDALRHQAMDILLGVRHCPDPAIHRHAGKPISVEPCNLLLRLEQLDHAHRGFVHCLV